jgi:DNA-binding response OmpR family regulator
MSQNVESNIPALKRIIIIEDDIEISECLVKFFAMKGYDVHAVGSALEFYRISDLHSYALAIVDLGLPDQNGLVIAKYLKSNTSLHILVLTGQTDIENRLESYEAGADAFMSKPVNFRELSALVVNLLDRGKQIRFYGSSSPDSPFHSDDEQHWKILRDGWLLITPKGNALKLTLKEYEFLLSLTNNSAIAFPRQDLLRILGYQNNEYGNRALESLVYRLRHKVEEHGVSIPVQTAHGIGYSFSANIVVV